MTKTTKTPLSTRIPPHLDEFIGQLANEIYHEIEQEGGERKKRIWYTTGLTVVLEGAYRAWKGGKTAAEFLQESRA